MWGSITNLPVGQNVPDPAEVRFILAGYSWKSKTFKIWTVYFHTPANEFRFREASTHKKRVVAINIFSSLAMMQILQMNELMKY